MTKQTFKMQIDDIKVTFKNGLAMSDKFDESEVKQIVQAKLKEIGIEWKTSNSITFYNDMEHFYVEGFLY